MASRWRSPSKTWSSATCRCWPPALSSRPTPRLLASNRLTVDESALTGESMPVSKKADFLCNAETPLADRKNMVYMGTIVTGGSGLAMVVATGVQTEIGMIQSLVGCGRDARHADAEAARPDGHATGRHERGPLRADVRDGHGARLRLAANAGLVDIAGRRGGPGGLAGRGDDDAGLGHQRLHSKKVLVRHLRAVESLGSVEVICLDKTGTLTMNKMTVVELRTSQQTVAVAEGEAYLGERPVHLALLARLQTIAASRQPVQRSQASPARPAPAARRLPDRMRDDRRSRWLQARMSMPCGPPMPLLKTIHRAEDRPWMVTAHTQRRRTLLPR